MTRGDWAVWFRVWLVLGTVMAFLTIFVVWCWALVWWMG